MSRIRNVLAAAEGEDRLTVISWRAFLGLLWATENESRPRPVRRLLRSQKRVAAKNRRPPGSRA
jgi:hypothetical protein